MVCDAFCFFVLFFFSFNLAFFHPFVPFPVLIYVYNIPQDLLNLFPTDDEGDLMLFLLTTREDAKLPLKILFF